MGRPPIDKGYDSQLPRIRVTSQSLDMYKKSAAKADKSLSQWVRNQLDKGLDEG